MPNARVENSTSASQVKNSLPVCRIHPLGKSPDTGSVIISQVYGCEPGGGSTYFNSFIELHNGTSSAVDLSTWSIQYADATSSTWSKTNLTGSIPAWGYYLIKENNGGLFGISLPTADVEGSIVVSSLSGKVALVNNQTTLSGSCPTDSSIVDLVGYGSTANCYEGSGNTGSDLNGFLSVERFNSGCTDTDNNVTDFDIISPNARNSSSPVYVCEVLAGAPSSRITNN